MHLFTQWDAFAPWVWLAALVLSFACAGLTGLDYFVGRKTGHFAIRLAHYCALAGLLMLAGFDCVWRLTLFVGVSQSAWPIAPLTAAVAVAALLFVAAAQFRLTQARWVRAAMACVAVTWSGGRMYEISYPASDSISEVVGLTAEQILEPRPRGYAVTDRGQRVPLFHCRKTEESRFEVPGIGIADSLMSLIVAVGPADVSTNCHGWVFMEGKAVVRGKMVDTILTDNGYQLVEQPRAGDLIVYRDSTGNPSHTGIVKSTGKQGIMVESKWGFLGRYLHQPEHQCYSTNYSYYRSPRQGHRLRAEPPKLTSTAIGLNIPWCSLPW